MPNLNIDSAKKHSFDAIVIGTGISGGWAAKELTEKGFKTLVLDRGRNVEHIVDYPTALKQPWELDHLGSVPNEIAAQYQKSRTNSHYIFSESTLHFLVKDEEQEYVQDKPFAWIRAYQVGGRSLLWARQTQRWSDFDFEGPARDGYAVDWPIRYQDLAPWYSYVEKFAGISGNRDGLDTLPDGEFLPPHEMSCIEQHFSSQVAQKYSNRHVIIGRCANLTQLNEIHRQQGRSQCAHRNLCERGCPIGGYFSSNASTLPWAARTGKMTLRPYSLVHSIIYDEKKQRATGVRVIDTLSGELQEFYAKIIFVNASAMNSNLILLNSKSNRFPNGLGNDNGLLGKFIGWHNYRGRISAEYDGFLDKTTGGRRPNGAYMPRFRNVYKQETDFLRGYSAQINGYREPLREGIGSELKDNLANNLGPWQIGASMVGEVITRESNFVQLDPKLKDKYGIPQMRFSVEFSDNELKMLKDFHDQFEEMLQIAGFRNIQKVDTKRVPGHANHEMGGVRMGKDPKTSLLNAYNQLHACKNVFVTDGACMTSTSSQNPSLTYMALTARAVDWAVKESKKHNL